MEAKLAEFEGCFDSEEIKDADKFEDKAVDFRNWFVECKYNEIQKNFDKLYTTIMKIAMHYRPKIQMCGCDCIYVLEKEAAPAQIAYKSKELQKSFDKLVQIGHGEVMPALLPAVTEKIDIVYKNTDEPAFHDFMMHFLETWTREDTAPYHFTIEFPKIIKHAGMAMSRYIITALEILTKRAKNAKTAAQFEQYTACVVALCEECSPIIITVKEMIEQFIEVSKELGSKSEKFPKQCEEIQKILSQAPSLPTNWTMPVPDIKV
ncbi:hypothetical protein TVAG_247440 [Trichomonas vaginalis G3]|uniref:Uncharacterized protein n=1 Tax=Trichomonas vaginalis (strain ATCC PRA-98 / G3) TaxID=412133 RepID=A2DKT2_TRIV3|nr:hypothetical protein TVAGG3_0560230 [Trichomonas vaginalis G3]EAY19065.1 hypothetical protein TVAG_247440 [Trichomonas vaginalis G3]KAI5521130.1 hypothetical protein TVAGG3_0560230 [Trichomonas vaginalis G3]|eukprot:XP_001580051.1 hypothetical protein [Trichomonas vaginalis G3]